MSFKINDPSTIKSPRKNLSEVKVLYNGGESPGSYSVAILKWNGNDAIGVRWNISENEINDPEKKNGSKISLGEPNSRGYPTWFILPDDMIMRLIEGGNLVEKLEKHFKGS